MLQIKVNDNNTFEVAKHDEKIYINNIPVELDIKEQPNGLISILYNGKSYAAIVEGIDQKNKELSLRINGQVHQVRIKEPIDQLLSSMGMDLQAMHKLEHVKAPMPGMVLKVLVTAGQQINKGDGLLVLEAMKMENILKAGANATVKAIRVSERTAVEKGAILIELE